VVGEHRIERFELAEHADLLRAQIDLRITLQDAARLDRLLQRGAFRQFHGDQRLLVGERVADFNRQARAHALP
jgi:hypothetical protein